MSSLKDKKQYIASMYEELLNWRHNFHQYPELGVQEKHTSEKVGKKLQEFGINIHKNIGATGIVGELRVGNGKKSIALRADMDALPIEEQNDLSYKSTNKGVMHACGHDGHMTMLLGAAKYLAKEKNFNGTVYFIFQPAEEIGEGAKAMIKAGLFTRFKIDKIFGLHIAPPVKPGYFSIFEGPVLASSNSFDIKILGKGGHGAAPHRGIDPIIVASEIVLSLQTILSRRIDPLKSAVLSVTTFHGGTTYNVIPNDVTLQGTVRTQSNEVKETIKSEMGKIIKGICRAFGTSYEFQFSEGDPATVNTKEETLQAISSVEKVVGKEKTLTQPRPVMASEDFGYFLQNKPGCYAGIGNGIKNGPNHSSKFKFNDSILTTGVEYWVQLVEDQLT